MSDLWLYLESKNTMEGVDGRFTIRLTLQAHNVGHYRESGLIIFLSVQQYNWWAPNVVLC